MKIGSSLSIASVISALSAQVSDVTDLAPAGRTRRKSRRFIPSNHDRIRNMGQRYKLRGQTGAQRLAALEKAEAKRARKAQFRLNQANQTNYRVRCAAA